MAFNFLPGTQVSILDGGLVTQTTPTTKSTIIIGTAGSGPADTQYFVTDRAVAASLFGFDGTLTRAMEEVGSKADNLYLYRMGTQQMQLQDVGKEVTVSPTPGFDIFFSQVTATAAADYKIWYKLGVLAVWYLGQLVYSNESGGAVDTGDLSFSVPAAQIASQTGMALGSGASPTLANAVTITAAAAQTPGTNEVSVVLVAPVTGLGLTGRETYIALVKSLDLLSNFAVEQVYCPDVLADEYNVAYYVAADATTALHNPATNPDALDWLKVATDSVGNKTYQWAADTADDQGNVVAAMSAVTSTARLAAGFYEVHPIYALANFCEAQLETVGSCVALIGTSGPLTFRLSDTRKWVGFMPTYSQVDPSQPTAAGSGLLGIPLLSGTVAAKLNPLTKDHATFRAMGLYKTDVSQYDGVVQYDRNANPIDLGQFVHVVADYALMSNGWGTNYFGNVAGQAIGILAGLDEKVNLTNQPVSVTQLWKPSQGQMDSLFQKGIDVLRFRGQNQQPVLLHGETVANPHSDYQNLLRVRVRGLVVDTARLTADPFIGQGSTDGLALTALQTALDQKYLTLQKRGYISRFSFKVFSTVAQQRIGHANIDINFMPAQELIQLDATVGISRS